MSQQTRGFSLAEILVVVSLMALSLGMLAVTWSAPRQRMAAQQAAEKLGACLRALAQQARASGKPQALALSTASGASPGFYLLQGEERPVLFRVDSWKREFPGVVASLASYVGPTWDSAFVARWEGAPFDVASWAGSFASDSLLVFLPSGEVASNVVPAEGAYRLTVAQQLAGSSTSLTGAYAPYTVSVTTTGHVTVQKGLWSAPALESQVSLTSALSPAQLPTKSVSSNQNPVLTSPYFVTSPGPGNPNPAKLRIAPGEKLRLRVNAKDPDGDALFATWRATSSSAGPLGSFAVSGKHKLRWEPAEQAWVDDLFWRAPDQSSQVDLDCLIEDDRGGSILLSSALAALPGYPPNYPPLAQEVGQDTPLFFQTSSPRAIWSCDSNGGQVKSYPNSGSFYQWRQPAISPDGKWMAWPGLYGGCYLASTLGGQPRKLCNEDSGYYVGAVQFHPVTGALWIREANQVGPNSLYRFYDVDVQTGAKTLLGGTTAQVDWNMQDCPFAIDPQSRFVMCCENGGYDLYACVFVGSTTIAQHVGGLDSYNVVGSRSGVFAVKSISGGVEKRNLTFNSSTNTVSAGPAQNLTIAGMPGYAYQLMGGSSGRFLATNDSGICLIDLTAQKATRMTLKYQGSSVSPVYYVVPGR